MCKIKLTIADVQIIEDIILKALAEENFIKDAFGIDNELDLKIQKNGIKSILNNFCFPITALGLEKELELKIKEN